MMNKEVLRTKINSSVKNTKDVGVLKFYIPSHEAPLEKALSESSFDKEVTKQIVNKTQNVEVLKTVIQSPVHIAPSVKEINVIPFVELKCSNTHEVYRYAKSFIKDKKEKDENCFSFYTFSEKSIDLEIVTIASCFSYIENNAPVLVVVSDVLCADFVRYRKSFTRGQLGSMETYEWGNVTIVDYKEILKKSSTERMDFKFISDEFECVFMIQPNLKILNELKESYLDMLSFADSVSFVVDAKNITVSELKSKEKYYHSMDIRLKGILFAGESK